VRDAVAFWNRTLVALGSGFRLYPAGWRPRRYFPAAGDMLMVGSNVETAIAQACTGSNPAF